MKIFLACIMLLTLVCTGVLFAQAQMSQPSSNSNPAEEEIRRLNVEEPEAFLHKDPKTLARLWSDDFVVTNPLNKFVNKQQVLGMVEIRFHSDHRLRPADRVSPVLWRHGDRCG
jgi:hypothetical protein